MGLKAPNRQCRHPGCPKLTRQTYCEDHRRNDAKVRADAARGTATERGYDHLWRKRSEWYRKRHGMCEWPLDGGCTHASEEVDHLVPREDGGSDEDENLQALCKSHHSFKTWYYDGGCGRAKKRFPPKTEWPVRA